MDTDVELQKGLDKLLEEKLVLAIERPNRKINTGLGFAAEKENETVHQLMKIYQNLPFIFANGLLNAKPCPIYITEFFKKKGYRLVDRTQRLGETLILSSEYFCPINQATGVMTISENTIGIHWFVASWCEQDDLKILQREREIYKKFPIGISKVMCFIFRKSYRMVEYIRKGILFKRLFNIWFGTKR